MELIFLIIGAVFLGCFLYYCKNSFKPIKYSIINMICGVMLLAAVVLIGKNVAVNYVTCFVSLVLGVPGVILLAVFGML